MNIHVPRSIQTSVELSELVAVPFQIVSSQANKPLIGCIQDSLLGCKKITDDSVRIPREQLLEILGHIPGNLMKIDKRPMWTGKEAFSLFLPAHLNYKSGDVLIADGQLIAGQLTKKHMGTASGSLIHIIWNDLGPKATVTFMDSVSTLVNRWLMSQGFSVGLSDAIVDRQTHGQINKIIDESKLKVFQEIVKFESETQPKENAAALFEHSVLNLLNSTRDKVGSLATGNVFGNNRIRDMVTAGSKGSPLNISQIMGLVGQQVVKNADGSTGRVADGFIDRPLPHTVKYTLEPKARGFVGNSYLSGLEPMEYFFHSMSGREGLIDTAIKTSDTGYLQRKLMKSMEDVKIGSGNYVQTINNQIVQFLYGGDSLDGAFLERETMIPIEISKFTITENDKSNLFSKTTMPKDSNFQEIELKRLENLPLPTSDSECVPFNIHRLLENSFKKRESKKSLVSYEYLYDNLVSLIDRLFINKMLESTERQYIKNIEYILLTKLSPKVLLSNWYFTKPQYITMLSSIEAKYIRSIVDPGECVGPLAAQAIGESLTQLTLNTFHSAGIASQTQITSGIPRFRELINVSKKPQNSTITIIPTEDYINSEEKAYTLAEHLKYTTLELFIEKLEISYDASNTFSTPDYYEDTTPIVTSPWVLTITLNPKMLYSKKVYISTIVDTLTHFCKSNDIISSSTHDNSDEMKIYLRAASHTTENYNTMMYMIQELPKVWICGQQQITDTYINEHNHIMTSGGHLEDILILPFVDPTKTISDNIFNTFDILGMEATRELLYSEIQKLLADNGVSINKRHIELLVDTITHRTVLLSMDRHGIKKSEASVLSSCSFEETVEQLAKASIFSQYDNLAGVTPDIMLGQLGKFGTSTSEIVYQI